jgi:hypothetical protein
MAQIRRRMFALGLHAACRLCWPWRAILRAVRRVFSILASERCDRYRGRARRAPRVRRDRLGPKGALSALGLHLDWYGRRGTRLAIRNGATLT